MPALDFPASPTDGQVYNNWVWSASKSAWNSLPLLPAQTTVSPVAPGSPAAGNLWFNSNDMGLYVYYTDVDSSQWVQVKASSSLNTTIPQRMDTLEARPMALNYIINAGMDVWQRGTTGTIASNTNGYPSADRWKVWAASAAAPALTLAQNSSVPDGIGVQWSAALSWTGSTSTGDVILGQPIENGKYLFAGKTVTVSFYAKANTAVTVTSNFDQDYNGSLSSAPSFNLTNSWQRFTYVTTLPTTYASSPPSGTASGSTTELRLVRLTGTSSGANTIYVTGVQVEAGGSATVFRRNQPNLQAELAACQRYFHREILNGYAGYLGFADSATSVVTTGTLPVPMRVAPTFASYGSLEIRKPGVASNAISPNPSGTLGDNRLIRFYTTTASQTTGNAVLFTSANGTGSYVDFNAEL